MAFKASICTSSAVSVSTKDLGVKSVFDARAITRDAEQFERDVFFSYKPDINHIGKISKKYAKFKNIILIGTGGAISTTYAIYKSLLLHLHDMKNKRMLYIANTVDPDYLDSIRKQCSEKDSLIIVASSSGINVTILETYLFFMNRGKYATIIIVNDTENTLEHMAEKEKLEIVMQPVITDRFAARTPMIYLPLAILGVDISAIDRGIAKMHDACCIKNLKANKNNPAINLSFALYELDKKGYDEIFMPIYSSMLDGFIPVITQLMHESVGKDGKGQTVLAVNAPESQHHTNQRFFGGKRNMIGAFVSLKEFAGRARTKVPKELHNLRLRTGVLGDLDSIMLGDAMRFEFEGTYHTAVKSKIPCVSIMLEKINSESVGEFLGLLHYIAFYSAVLRGVNPLDQPGVEESKKISFELRKKHAR